VVAFADKTTAATNVDVASTCYASYACTEENGEGDDDIVVGFLTRGVLRRV